MSEAMLTVKAHRGIIEFETGHFTKSTIGRAAIDLKRVVAAEEANPEQWGWDHATWVSVEQGGPYFLNVAFDGLLELWRAAMCN